MVDINRRDLLASLAALGIVLPVEPGHAEEALSWGPARPYSFEALVAETQALAAVPYVPEIPRSADVLDRIDYDQHQRIEYLRQNTLELNAGAAPIRFFHLGRYFKLPVGIHVVENGEARAVTYDPGLFRIPEDNPARALPDDSGFAGFRVLEPNSDRDWLSFLGAAYFRTSGELDQFGLSARALAIDVAMPTPEEFPRFTDFYVGASDTGGRIKIACRMNSPRIAGVLEMDCSKDGPIVMDIRSRYFAREAIERVGIAPLTSMFWYSEPDRGRRIDWRPEIHDSDGLSIWTGEGERLWRPLNNPAGVMTSTFSGRAPKGFGLLQRDRDFASYEDDGVFYERRASVWIEPRGDWGDGSVQLVEIPTDDEIHDNIAAYWLSARPVAKGDALAYDYRLTWAKDAPVPQDVGSAVATRLGRGGITGQPRPADVVRIVVDFDGGALGPLPAEAKDVEPVVSASRGTVSLAGCYRVKVGTAWRATFDLKVTGTDPVELRLYLRNGERTLTETWAYQFLPLARQAG